MTIEIGKLGSNSIGFDIPTLIETRLLVQANSGGGKSWALRRLLEQSHGQVQQIVIDLEGEFSTLRQKFDYVIAAKDGDTAAHPGSAKLLARRLLELRVSAICDIYELEKHDRIRFVRIFLESLMTAPRSLWHPVLLVLDEAQHFCPEKGQSEAAPAVIDLATRGRKRGFCAVLATQRLAKLHKDVCAETLNKLIGRTGLDIDQMRAADELGIRGKEDRLLLRRYKPGEFSVFGPALRIGKTSEAGVVKVFVGPVKSIHPSVGARHIQAPPAPTAAIKKVLSGLKDLPEAAEQEAQDIKDLRKDIARLKRELSLSQKNMTDRTRNSEFEKQLEEKYQKDFEALKVVSGQNLKSLIAIHKILSTFTAHIKKVADDCNVTALEPIPLPTPGKTPRLTGLKIVRGRNSAAVPIKEARSQSPPVPSPEIEDGFISRSRQRILDALLAYKGLGLSIVHKNSLAALAGVSPKSGGYFNNLGALRTAGLIDYPQTSHARLTEIGKEHAQPTIIINNEEDLREAWLNIVTLSQAKILTVAIDIYPDQISKEDLAERIGVSGISGGFFNNLGRLRTLGVIDYPGPGQVKATSLLFPAELT